jgi:regulatory protein
VPLASKPDPVTDPGDAARQCRRQALDLLARRDHSRLELERKLTTRGYAPPVVGSVLDGLQQDRLLEEDRFVESFIRSRARKGQGPARIRLELGQRGIDEGRARDGLAQAGVDWFELAAEARAKRFGAGPPGDFKARVRQAKFLQYRGFDSEQIRAALDLADDSD